MARVKKEMEKEEERVRGLHLVRETQVIFVCWSVGKLVIKILHSSIIYILLRYQNESINKSLTANRFLKSIISGDPNVIEC